MGDSEAKPASAWIARHHQPTWIQIPAFSVARAKAFYESVLDFTFRPAAESGPDLAYFLFPNGPFEHCLTGGIVKIPAMLEESLKKNSPCGMSVVYFHTDDLEMTLQRVEKEGGAVLKSRWQPHAMHEMWIADFRDTEGNFHGLVTDKAAT